MSHLYKIIDKQGNRKTFKPNREQAKLLEVYLDKKSKKLPLRENILKDRQIGITTFHCLYYLDEVIWNRNRTAAIIAHKQDALERIFRIAHFAWSNLPDVYKPSATLENKRELGFKDINSTMYVALKVRSGTVQHLHVSERAYIEDPRELKTGSFQAVPIDGDITCETTGNGIDDFYKDWMNPGKWQNHFFSWLEHDEYRSKDDRSGEYETYLDSVGADKEQKNWWYWKFDEIKDFQDMLQEYPAKADDSFKSSGGGVFKEIVDIPKDSIVLRTEEFVEVYEEPSHGQQYCIGADTSGGFSDGDYSVFFIMNSKTWNVAMKWRGRMQPDLFGLEIMKWANTYNNAFVGIEVNNHGLSVINSIKNDYSELYVRERRDRISDEITKEIGWLTTDKSKIELIDEIRRALRDGDVKEIPHSLREEMRTFIRKENGRCEAELGCHDDEVMAFGITLMMLKANPYFKYEVRYGKFMGR